MNDKELRKLALDVLNIGVVPSDLPPEGVDVPCLRFPQQIRERYIKAANPEAIIDLLKRLEYDESIWQKWVNKNDTLQTRLAAKQYEIDALMLEYCPDEMSESQMKTWADNQVEATTEDMGI